MPETSTLLRQNMSTQASRYECRPVYSDNKKVTVTRLEPWRWKRSLCPQKETNSNLGREVFKDVNFIFSNVVIKSLLKLWKQIT